MSEKCKACGEVLKTVMVTPTTRPCKDVRACEACGDILYEPQVTNSMVTVFCVFNDLRHSLYTTSIVRAAGDSIKDIKRKVREQCLRDHEWLGDADDLIFASIIQGEHQNMI